MFLLLNKQDQRMLLRNYMNRMRFSLIEKKTWRHMAPMSLNRRRSAPRHTPLLRCAAQGFLWPPEAVEQRVHNMQMFYRVAACKRKLEGPTQPPLRRPIVL